MKSIFTSEKKAAEPILTVENVNLIYRLDMYRNFSWRDAFTAFSKSPLETIAREKERFQILKDINFKIYEGERVGLLGVNGAGKSSLCRCISKMFHPTSGKITCAAPIRAVFNTGVGIHPDLTGRENAMLLAHFIFPEAENIKELVEEALVFSELGRFVDVPYKTYSSGMQTRLYLSLISARSTGLLILDEVFDGADVFFREKIATRVLDMIHQSGAAIFVSHSYEQIRKVCNRVIVLRNSQIAYDGVTEHAIDHFQNSQTTAAAR